MSVLLTVELGCTQPAERPARNQPAPVQTAQYETGGAAAVLPQGDPRSGRQAFLDLKCVVCHRVTREPEFPAPVSDSRGPDLDQGLRRRPSSELAAAIVLPSHAMSLKTSDEIKNRVEGGLSPMPDFSRIMTVRQLADLLAYLQSL
jgi:mono/diheme cytochrome c family protein